MPDLRKTDGSPGLPGKPLRLMRLQTERQGQPACERCNKQKSAMNHADYRIYKNALKSLF